MLEIDKTADSKNEIHYTTIFEKYNRWSNDGSLGSIFNFKCGNGTMSLFLMHLRFLFIL